MAVAQRSGRTRYRLGLLILTALALLTLDFRGYGPLETAQSRIRDLLAPVVSVVDVVLGPVAEVWTVMFSYNDLRAENAELRAEVDRLRTADIRDDAARGALERLLSATDLDYVSDVERVSASVLRDSVGNFDDDVISIDVGRRDGVVPGMAVVTEAGFIGRIDAVDATLSTVTTISSSTLSIGVRLLDTGDVGLGHGVAGEPALFVVETGLEWPDTGDLSELPAVGSSVVTSAASRYPADIPVGWILSVEPAEAGLAQRVMVELAADTREIGYVTVLLQPPKDDAPEGPDSPFPVRLP